MKKMSNIITSILFLGFIFTMGAYFLFASDKEISETENRSLAGKPELQVDAIVSGTFTEEYSAYITDQFPLRDTWIKGYLQWQLVTNQTFINDYYLDGDWVYPRPFTEVDDEAITYAVDQMTDLNEFAKEQALELYYFSLPDRRYMIDMQFPNRVENNVLQQDKERLLAEFPKDPMQIIDVGEKWQEKWNNTNYRDYYFRTDHHWNMDGALLAYEEIHQTLYETSDIFSSNAFDRNAYKEQCLPDKQFLGSYNRQLYGYVDAEGEELCYSFPSQNNVEDWSVYVHGLAEEDEVPFEHVYGLADNSESDVVTYSDLYAVDRDEIHFINPNKEGKVIVLKDSYANPLLPLIADNFYQTTFYDVRHNEGRDMYDYIKEHEFDTIIFLYSNGRTLDYLYDW